ncbi:RyR domain-containing protein [Inediibacterium massiliense]|uniref:RyR domain-containing protein n=1 Tax=Inediibacterium massiliense TaxID=1658111 RepID=UPI0006B4BEDA|nr:RyR domain-containing protein [Inediibacterium massiliense]
MDDKKVTIVVSGDICINSLRWITYPQNNDGLNWQTYLNMHTILKPGESLLLSKLVALATGVSVRSPKIKDIELDVPKGFLLSNATIELFPVSADEKDKDQVYRVKDFMGFTGPSAGNPKLLPIHDDDTNADLVIIDDENNGFNSNEEFWPLAIKSSKKSPIVLYKMNNPISSSDLWKHLEKFHIKNTIVVINADDLRSKGVNISKSLSWERTSQDFVWQINNNPNLAFLSKCHHLIVPFGLEGAIYYRNDGTEAESRLYFLPYEFEGGFVKDTQGKMYGLTSCFVAGLSRSIVAFKNHNKKSLSYWLGKGIREGIVFAQKYFIEGFGKNIEKFIFPNASIFVEGENDFIYKEYVQDVKIPNESHINGYSTWYILEEKSSANLAEMAYDIVKNGERKVLKSIPSAQFGKLKTVDRTEIESYRSIKNLMLEYISTTNTVRPLSISVFGTPGSGKSFGIMEIAASIAPNLIQPLNFNLSQFRTTQDLINCFHKVRDLSLEGKVPLVFFDEFDSTFEGNLGWLKYFLAPMQDGVFREGDVLHPIGKAIFVFGGGTSSSFKEFCGEDITDEQEQKQFLKAFKSAKGPDFISRLRGYVNILGPNQANGKLDQLFIIRRAMLLRSLLERKEPHLINEKGEAQIDNGVLRALLKIPRYKHESRSMEAILEMSMLNKAKKWEQSHLPSREQLKLHVDEDQFLRHLMQDAFFSEKIENLAKAIHEKYIMLNKDNKNMDIDFVKPWEELSEDLKSSNLDHAKNIPSALLKINYDVVSVKEKPKYIHFTEDELDILANYEHTRWCLHRKEAGWTHGSIKDMERKTDPALVPWESLPEDKKNKVYQMVKIWPEILSNSNFKIEPLKFSSDKHSI